MLVPSSGYINTLRQFQLGVKRCNHPRLRVLLDMDISPTMQNQRRDLTDSVQNVLETRYFEPDFAGVVA